MLWKFEFEIVFPVLWFQRRANMVAICTLNLFLSFFVIVVVALFAVGKNIIST